MKTPTTLLVLGQRIPTTEAASHALEYAGVEFATILTHQGREVTIPIDGSRLAAHHNGADAIALHDLWVALRDGLPVFLDSPHDPWLARTGEHHRAAAEAGFARAGVTPRTIEDRVLAAAVLVYNAERAPVPMAAAR